MTESATQRPTEEAHAATLYLRTDGTMLVAHGSLQIELYLAPADLVDLAITQLTVAMQLDPTLGGRVLEVMERSQFLVPVEEVPQCNVN